MATSTTQPLTEEPQIGDIRIRVSRDHDPENPRDEENLAVMFCRHRRYTLGDKDAVEKNGHLVETLPLYMYDHSGLTVRTTPFSCPWDSGQLGVVYMTHKVFIEETGYATDEEKKTGILGEASRAKCREMIVGEVATYDQYLQGNIYVVDVEKCVPGDWEVVESCGGFYGTDFDNGMSDYIDEEHHEKLKAALEAA